MHGPDMLCGRARAWQGSWGDMAGQAACSFLLAPSALPGQRSPTHPQAPSAAGPRWLRAGGRWPPSTRPAAGGLPGQQSTCRAAGPPPPAGGWGGSTAGVGGVNFAPAMGSLSSCRRAHFPTTPPPAPTGVIVATTPSPYAPPLPPAGSSRLSDSIISIISLRSRGAAEGRRAGSHQVPLQHLVVGCGQVLMLLLQLLQGLRHVGDGHGALGALLRGGGRGGRSGGGESAVRGLTRLAAAAGGGGGDSDAHSRSAGGGGGGRTWRSWVSRSSAACASALASLSSRASRPSLVCRRTTSCTHNASTHKINNRPGRACGCPPPAPA